MTPKITDLSQWPVTESVASWLALSRWSLDDDSQDRALYVARQLPAMRPHTCMIENTNPQLVSLLCRSVTYAMLLQISRHNFFRV